MAIIGIFGVDVRFEWRQHHTTHELFPTLGGPPAHKRRRVRAQLVAAHCTLRELLPPGKNDVDLVARWEQEERDAALARRGGLRLDLERAP
eukprot:SAG11_NODE_14026_length_628_cov_0.952741_1_plen_91_part_00